MNPQEYMLVVAVGAAAIALWVDVRLTARTPRTLAWTLAHVFGALLSLKVVPQLVAFVVGGSEDPARKIAAVLLVFLPALTYCWLSTIWLLKLVQRAAHLRP